MDVKGSIFNLSSAATLTSYKPAETRAKCLTERLPLSQGAAPDKLALVIPALREAANLGGLLSRIRPALDHAAIPWEVIVVDDDSGDGTEQIVSTIARQDPRVRLLVRHSQRGLAGAILHGWQHTDATILGAMDADGQHPAEILPRLLAAIRNGRDLAIASRYVRGSRRPWNPLRQIVSRAAILAARPLLRRRPRVCDPLSGFFLVRRNCIDPGPFQSAGFKLLLEILVRGRVTRISEIPFAFGRRGAGRSKINLRVVCDYLLLLARLYPEKKNSILVDRAMGD
jgi:dolichol-phosphate mannosyltransferase